MELTKSQARYIQVVYELSPGGQGVRVCEIARYMGYSKASVSLAMGRLEKSGLISKGKGRRIFLTVTGERTALQLMNKLDVLERALVKMLGVRPETAARDAAAIGNRVSVDTLCALCRFGGSRREHGCLRSCNIAHFSNPPPGQEGTS
jgi:DtxR family Mn-dependent transcriptional regulator